MIRFSPNLICASLFTGIYDVNRNEMLPSDEYSLIEKWCQSVQNLGLEGIVFHNNFSEKTIREAQNDQINFIKVDFDTPLNANVYRYPVYFDFLKRHADQIHNVFFTDIADVEVVKNPFDDSFFLENPEHLFCGDEKEILDNPWMKDHCTHLRNLIPEFLDFEERSKSQTLLNCGVIGGNTAVMLLLLEKLTQIHTSVTVSNQTPFTLDMGAFNFVARTTFSNRLKHGVPVNTLFKGYESERMDCWFRHK
ncbi:MAG: hypothetical protein Q8S14_12880 [Algoriphagus sp.]|uniref:hypothetical protein n=1 Tax=Algoriphagus sp. TaxID=1872435 RepID=UPI002716CC7E|nr:hypothetical protein [Algoriphagus sp.]MDO8966248.1 hypothetical protein [Algoriphagus sp.]MDP2041032.1 hypothetical protein [Algoriphagus sp.]MDP3198686.1 hypothetical protein [Algoriphagus sp.]MDP3472760.1 hypothetical protein [Algoriphagus sp.]